MQPANDANSARWWWQIWVRARGIGLFSIHFSPHLSTSFTELLYQFIATEIDRDCLLYTSDAADDTDSTRWWWQIWVRARGIVLFSVHFLPHLSTSFTELLYQFIATEIDREIIR